MYENGRFFALYSVFTKLFFHRTAAASMTPANKVPLSSFHSPSCCTSTTLTSDSVFSVSRTKSISISKRFSATSRGTFPVSDVDACAAMATAKMPSACAIIVGTDQLQRLLRTVRILLLGIDGVFEPAHAFFE